MYRLRRMISIVINPLLISACSGIIGLDGGSSDPLLPGTWYQSESQSGVPNHGSSGYRILWQEAGSEAALAFTTRIDISESKSCTFRLELQYWDVPRSYSASPLAREVVEIPCRAKEEGGGNRRTAVLAFESPSGGSFISKGEVWYQMSNGLVKERVLFMTMRMPSGRLIGEVLAEEPFVSVPGISRIQLPDQLPSLAYDQGRVLR